MHTIASQLLQAESASGHLLYVLGQAYNRHETGRRGLLMNFWNFTRSPASIRLLLDFGRSRGFSSAQLLKGSRVIKAQLDNPQLNVSPGQELAVIGNLLRLTAAQPGMGLQLGLRYQLSAYGVLGLGLMSSATGINALRLAQKFLPLTYTFVPIAHRRDENDDVLLFEPPEALANEVRDFVVERAMGATLRVLHDITGAETPAVTVRLRGEAAPASIMTDLLRQLGRKPQWGAGENLLAIPHRLTRKPLPQANTMTAAMCERMCEELVERRRTRLDTATLVREYLATVPDEHMPKLSEVAALLCTSERTLKRWFRDEDTSFRALLEQSRRSRADQLLADPANTLTQIAIRMGFSDLSSFSQAYKRWTGTTPSLSAPRRSQSQKSG